MRTWAKDSLHITNGGSCERWTIHLVGGAAYITNADAAYRKLTKSPKGWWLQCDNVLGFRRKRLEALTARDAKREASEIIAQTLERIARELRRGVAPEVLDELFQED